MEKKIHINQINNRQYILSPAVQSGNDRECINKDFYQEEERSTVRLGKLGLGMKVVHRRTKDPYTIIHFEKERVSRLRLQKKINSTLDLMYRSSHPYLFRLLNHYETETHVFMIFESYDGDSLDNIIVNGKCDLQNSLKYLVEVMLGVQHMHKLFNLYNLNVNPENILVDECVKLTDYQLKMEGKNVKPKRITIYKKKDNLNYLINAYTSPEELNAILTGNSNITEKTDSWNCGILLFEMLTSFQSPFKGKTDEEFIDAILNCKIDLSPIKDDFCRDLISKLVKKDPKDRISIDDVLQMDYIKNVDIEQPEIDFSDNIINPIDEQNFINNIKNNINNTQTNNNTNSGSQEYKKEVINLRSENDSLKKMVEDLRKQVVSSKMKRKVSKHVSKLKSMVIDAGGEIVADDNEGQNLEELLNEEGSKTNEKAKNENKENKLEEMKKELKNEVIEEEEDDEEEFSEKEDEYTDDNLFVRCEKYKERNIQLKEKLSKMSKKFKKMKNLADELKKENDILQNEKNKNILETLAKMNTVPIYEINDLVNVILNSINAFKSSQNEFKNSVEKLISKSDEQSQKLSEENKQYIDSKAKLFIDIMNNKITDVDAFNKLNNNKNDENKKEQNTDNKIDVNKINNDINLNKKIEEYKNKYEDLVETEKKLNTRIEDLEEIVKKKEDVNKSALEYNEVIFKRMKEVGDNWVKSKMLLISLDKFIETNVDKQKVQEFYDKPEIRDLKALLQAN
jgi:serine/threonine protein kinase